MQVGTSLFFVDQIIEWISDGTHRFWLYFEGEEVDVIDKQNEASGRLYLTTEGAGFPPVVLLSLPRTWIAQPPLPASGGRRLA
ncbi:hypothetical protein [Sphingopyxis sp.]|uniref:hypothetical protein n=1 Tax=Sphingopyxis sp. TaxID=1908224 RepID=UPI002ED9EBDA